jgi:16S rRNA processing protein RimM
LVLERVRWQGRTPILKFRDIDSREDAHRLAHAVVQIARAVIPPLPPGKFYLFEIIGLEVITDGGRPVGRIRDVLLLPANDVYVIDAPEGEILIPATREIVRDVDISRKKVVIHPLPGLLEPQP